MNDNNEKKNNGIAMMEWVYWRTFAWQEKGKKTQYITTYDADTKIWGYNISDQDEER